MEFLDLAYGDVGGYGSSYTAISWSENFFGDAEIEIIAANGAGSANWVSYLPSVNDRRARSASFVDEGDRSTFSFTKIDSRGINYSVVVDANGIEKINGDWHYNVNIVPGDREFQYGSVRSIQYDDDGQPILGPDAAALGFSVRLTDNPKLLGYLESVPSSDGVALFRFDHNEAPRTRLSYAPGSEFYNFVPFYEGDFIDISKEAFLFGGWRNGPIRVALLDEDGSLSPGIPITNPTTMLVDDLASDWNTKEAETILRRLFNWTREFVDYDDPEDVPVGSLGIRGDAAEYIKHELVAAADPATFLTTGSPQKLSQSIELHGTDETLQFSIMFRDAGSTLDVRLGDFEVARLVASPDDLGRFQTFAFTIPGSGTSSDFATLSFTLDGPHGSRAVIDDVTFRGIVNGDFSRGDFGWVFDGEGEGEIGFVFSNEDAARLLIPENVDYAPLAVDDTGLSVAAGSSLYIPYSLLLTNDHYADSVWSAGPAIHGSVEYHEDGVIFTPEAGFTGTAQFEYLVENFTAEDIGTVYINVRGVGGNSPVAGNDTGWVAEDGTLAVTAVDGVLKNDTDIDGEVLSALLVNGPVNGTLTLNLDGSFDYTPNANYFGADSFTYQASDGSRTSNTATVTINVGAVNDAPLATADTFAATEDTKLTVLAASGVLKNDTDADDDTLTATLVTGPTKGTLTLYLDGAFEYTPNANFFGTDSFTYKVSDGSLTSNTATVTIHVAPVNDAPEANADTFTTAFQTKLVVSAAKGALANDTDVEGDALSTILATGPTKGTLGLDPDGSVTYTPNTGFTGIDTFTYKAFDGTDASNLATVTIKVGPPSGAANVIEGTPGDDRSIGSSRRDDIRGGEGNDYVSGAGGDDALDGGSGNDFLIGGEGDDQYTGSTGADQFRIDARTISGTDTDYVQDLAFDEGDRLVLASFAPGTFQGIAGGNHLNVVGGGTGVIIDSFADIAELTATSAQVTAVQSGGTQVLILTVIDGDGDIQNVHISNAVAGFLGAGGLFGV